MKVYVACRYERRAEAVDLAIYLKSQGHEVTSSWLFSLSKVEGENSFIQMRRYAKRDLVDIKKCDAIVCLTEKVDSRHGRGGRHVEAGFAMALGKKVYIIGFKENVFYCMPEVKQFVNSDEFKVFLGKLK